MYKIIVAHDRKFGIGKDGKIPWHFSADLKWFKKQTIGHTVIMGRKTYESIGKPLPDRDNIVLSRKADIISGVEVVHSLLGAIRLTKDRQGDNWIIGGSEIYRMFLEADLVGEIYGTHIYGDYGCDRFFNFTKLKGSWKYEIIAGNANYYRYKGKQITDFNPEDTVITLGEQMALNKEIYK